MKTKYLYIFIILLLAKPIFPQDIVVPMGELFVPKQTSPLIIQGRVENSTRDRVQGMTVCLSTDRSTCLDRDEATAITDGIGEYEMRVNLPGQYTVLVKDEAPEPVYKSGKSDIFIASIEDLWQQESKTKTIPPIALDLAAVPATVYFTFTNSLQRKIRAVDSVTIAKFKSASDAGQDAVAGLLSGDTSSADDAFGLETECTSAGDDVFSCIILASPVRNETNRFKVKLTKAGKDTFQPVSIDTRGDGTGAVALMSGRTSTQGSPFSMTMLTASVIPEALVLKGDIEFENNWANELFGKNIINEMSLKILIGDTLMGMATLESTDGRNAVWELRITASDIRRLAGSVDKIVETLRDIRERNVKFVLNDGEKDIVLGE